MKLKPPRNWQNVKGIFVGGCVERGEGSSFRAKAHSHCFAKYPYFGWICVRSLRRIGEYRLFDQRLADIGVCNYDGFDGRITKPSQLLLHEYAHILAPNQGHTVTFFKRLREIGGHITRGDRYWCPKTISKYKKGSKI